jgi:hypothetical protein
VRGIDGDDNLDIGSCHHSLRADLFTNEAALDETATARLTIHAERSPGAHNDEQWQQLGWTRFGDLERCMQTDVQRSVREYRIVRAPARSSAPELLTRLPRAVRRRLLRGG